jgi:hypothetical protein
VFVPAVIVPVVCGTTNADWSHPPAGMYAVMSLHGSEPLKRCDAVHWLSAVVDGTGAPPTDSAPVIAADPCTVKFPDSVSENAEIPLVVVTVANVGAVGSLGKITFGICFVVIDGPLISISYRPGAA